MGTLARDTVRRSGPTAPRFPAALVVQERRYLDAIVNADMAELTAARHEFEAALEALMVSDRERLAKLEAGGENPSEREFLRLRANLLGARRDLLVREHLAAGGLTPESLGLDRPQPPQGAATAKPRVPDHELAPAQPPLPSRPQVFTRAAGPRTKPAPDPSPRHRDDIQGLRAVAVLLVVLAHAGVGFLQGGYVGVDVFFVLSGFLITGLLLSEARRRRYVSLVNFYLRRARRILPAAALTLVATDVAAYYMLNAVRAKQYLQDSIPSALFGANIHFAAQGTDYFSRGQPPSPLQHFWSLAVEEQFYVVWPLLFALVLGLALRRFGRRPERIGDGAVNRVLVVIGLIAVGSLVWSGIYTSTHPAAAYFSTLARAWELALGAGLAIGASKLTSLSGRARIGLGWTGLAFILIAAVAYSPSTPFPGVAALLPTVGAGMLIVAGMSGETPHAGPGRLLSLPPMRYLGDRSYAFYLWHWPVLIIAEQYAGHSLSTATKLLLVAGALALSVVSYATFERPIRFAAWARRPEALLLWPASVVSVLIVAGTFSTTIENRDIQQRLAADATPVANLTVAPGPPASTSAATSLPGSVPEVSQQLPAVMAEVNSEGNHGSLPAVLDPPTGDLLSDVPQIASNCMAHDGQSSSDLCRLGVSASSRTVVLIGDSHAEMWLPDVLALAQRDGLAMVPLMKSACSPPLWKDNLGTSDCHAWFPWVIARIAALHPDLTLIAGEYSHLGSGPTQATLDGIDAVVRGVKPHSRHTVLIGDVPARSQQPVDCLLKSGATRVSCSDSLTQSEGQVTDQVAQTTQADKVPFIDTTGWFCYQSDCPLVVGNLITYRDNNHVSQTYARALSSAFEEAVKTSVGGAY